MNPRERTLALILGVLVLFVVFGGGAYSFYSTYKSGQDSIESLNTELKQAKDKIDAVEKEQPQLNRWRRLSLLPDTGKARSDYNQYLRDLMSRSGLLDQSITADKNEFKSAIVHPTKPNKVPIYTGLTFDVDARASMTTLIAFLKEFQRTPKMHRLKKLTIERSETLVSSPKGPPKKSTEGADDPPDLIVRMTIEALIILDADQIQKRSKIPDRLTLTVEALSALRGGPTGHFLAAWAVGPNGPLVPPINMPLLKKARDYDAVSQKNIFKGWQPFAVDPSSVSNGPALALEDINLMKFRNFTQVTAEHGRRGQTVSLEAMLWDITESPKLGSQIIKMKPGFKNIPLVQARDKTKLIYGQVLQLDYGEIVFRVTLNAKEPGGSKWWRYADDKNFYRLHEEDLAALAASKKVKNEDNNQLYLVADRYWNEMTENKKVQLSKDKKTFQFAGSYGWGDVVYRDSYVVVIKMLGWPPEKAPQQPSLGASRLYPGADSGQIYSIHKNHLALVMAVNSKVKAEEQGRIFVIDANYFDYLQRDQLVGTPETGKFAFYHNLVRGDILSRDFGVLVLRVADKYCEYPGDEYEVNGKEVKVAKYLHEGLCSLKIGQKVQDALLNPLPPNRVKEILNPPGVSTAAGAAAPPVMTRVRRMVDMAAEPVSAK